MLALQEPEKPVRDPVTDAVKYLLAHQAKDGSWGGPPEKCTCRQDPPAGAEQHRGDLESTAWAILAITGAGYTELSEDELGSHKVGRGIREQLRVSALATLVGEVLPR